MTHEEWLRVNTFICPHGLGRISPEQCAANRSRPRLGDGAWGLGENLTGTPVMPGPCEKCTEWQALCKEVYQRRKEEAMAKVGICKHCGEQKNIKARGLCARCYEELKKKDKLPPVEKPGVEKGKVLRVVVDFALCPVLYERLKEKADEEMRPLATQLLWELKKAFLLNGKEKKGGTV